MPKSEAYDTQQLLMDAKTIAHMVALAGAETPIYTRRVIRGRDASILMVTHTPEWLQGDREWWCGIWNQSAPPGRRWADVNHYTSEADATANYEARKRAFLT